MSLCSLNETKLLLFQSCKDGSSGTVQQLLTQHSDLRDQINLLTDGDGNSALMVASENGHTGIVKLLLECGTNVDHKNSRGWTALMKASEKGDTKLEIIDLLLAHGAQVDLQNDDDKSALMVAAQKSQAKLATKLVQEYGASICLPYAWRTALMEASESGSIDIVKLLLDHGADDLGWALVLAILNKHNDIVELLLEYGAQVDDKNWSLFLDKPPLVVAVEKGNVNIVKLLLQHGAKQGLDWAIREAIFNKNDEVFHLLSGHGAQVDTMDWSYPALVEAVENGDIDIVKLLLEHGAKQGIGQAITNAIILKNVEIIKVLSEYGAQLDEVDTLNQPLLVAVEKGDADVVKMLLEHCTKQGIDRAITSAIFSKNTEIITILSEHGAQVDDIKYQSDDPPLVVAVEKGDADVIKLLLKHGANIDQKNSRGWTALMKASQKGDSKLEIIELLLKYVAQVDLQNDHVESALMVAAQNGQTKLATKLVQEYGALSVGLTSRTALMKASESGSIDIVKLLLDHSADDLGWALVLAILNKHSDIIELLLEHGAQVDDKNWSLFLTQPPLVAAVETGDANTVKLLIEHGAKHGIYQAIRVAVFNKNTKVIHILLGHGIQMDEMYRPVLEEAVEKGDADIVKLLLEHGAIQGLDWAITTAIFSKNDEIINMLSEYGGLVDEDWSDLPPLVEAVERGDADIVKLLLKHGAEQDINWAITNAIFDKHAEIIHIFSELGAQVDEDWLNFYQDPLVEAIKEGDADVIKQLLAHGAKLDSEWVVSEAIQNEQTEIIQILLEHGAQVNDNLYEEGIDEEPYLVTVCKIGNTNIVKLLLEHGAKESEYRGWALTEAILHKHTEVVDLLLEYGICVADEWERLELDCPPAIVEASENNDIDSLRLLLKYGEKQQYQDYLGWALSNATTPEIFKLLLDSGAKMDEKDHDGAVPLVLASKFWNTAGIKMMLNHGAKKYGYLPEALVEAIVDEHADIIKVLTHYGAHVDDESWFEFDKMPALVKASMEGDVKTVKLLLKHGAEKNLDWALEVASKGGHTKIVNFLFDYGVEVDDCDMFDTAALVEASRNGKTDTVRFLLEELGIMNRLGLALRAASGEGHINVVHLLFKYGNAEDLGYAFIEASRSGRMKVIKFLIKICDVFINFQDKEQTTALIIASQNGHADSAKLLIECGAEVNIQNSHGTSALMAASQANHTDVVKLLLKYGANVNLKDNNGQTAAKITNNDNILALFAAISDNKFDAIESDLDLHKEVQFTQEEEAHLIAIENAITETGTLDHTLVHGVFVGPPRSGKDSIMKRLLGEVVPNTSPSTGAVETAIHVKVEESCTYAATIGQSNWTRLEYDEEALHLMKTASKNTNSSASYPIEEEEFTDTQIADPPPAVKNTTPDVFHKQKRTMHSMQTEITSEIQPEIDPQPVAFQDETSFQMNRIEQMHRKRKHKTPIEIFKEAIKKKGLEGIRKQLSNSWSLYLTNTGGQMEFQELLPLLVSGPSMFFITFQLHKDLNECFQVEYELSSGESSKCYQSSLSILDSILQTLSTIAAMGTFVYKGLQKKCVPLKPKVFLIGTHKDLLDKKSAATIIDRIDAQLQTVIKSTSHYREGIIQFASKSRMIFSVNNLDPSDSDFRTIRSAVEKTVEIGDYQMKSPAHWMIYSLVVRQLHNRVESYADCFAIAKECGIKDENEFNEALHFIHTKMGLVRYFPHQELKDIVIVNPQILFEKVTELIVETFTFENLHNRSKLEAFENMGIFDLNDFTKISSRTGQNLTPTLFAKLLEYLRIAAQFQQGGETKYFLPCALTHAQVKQNVYNSTIPQLIATFQCGYCPKGLFGTLITFLINNEMQSDFEWELDTENIYRDEVCFQVGPYDTVTIRFMPTHLQISCAESNPELPRINCTQEDICQEVRESVEKGIKTVTSAINYINAQHSFTFYCTSDICSEDPHPSKLKKLKEKLCSLKCEKLKKCFPLPSGFEKWKLCSSMIEECHSVKERLNKCHCSFLIDQLSTKNCEAKWRKIGTHLKFLQKELDIIQANPLLLNDAPTSWLSVMLSDWIEWAPGDSRGSTSYANLEDLKSAVSKAGFGVVAEELSLPQEVAAGESDQSTDTGRKRTSSSAAESSSKRPHLS